MAQLFWESNFNNARAGNVISSIATVSHDKKVAFVIRAFVARVPVGSARSNGA